MVSYLLKCGIYSYWQNTYTILCQCTKENLSLLPTLGSWPVNTIWSWKECTFIHWKACTNCSTCNKFPCQIRVIHSGLSDIASGGVCMATRCIPRILHGYWLSACTISVSPAMRHGQRGKVTQQFALADDREGITTTGDSCFSHPDTSESDTSGQAQANVCYHNWISFEKL